MLLQDNFFNRPRYSKRTENFKRPKNREDSSDLDENLTESIAAMRSIISKIFFWTSQKKSFGRPKKFFQNIEVTRPINVSHEILCPAGIAHRSGQGNGHDRGAAHHMFCAREPLEPHPSSSLLDLTWPTGKGRGQATLAVHKCRRAGDTGTAYSAISQGRRAWCTVACQHSVRSST